MYGEKTKEIVAPQLREVPVHGSYLIDSIAGSLGWRRSVPYGKRASCST